jgi:endonuclease/exonuclease/phosphatase family metal-dependent hydrolase
MLRLVSSNILHGRSIVDGQVDTQRYVRALSELQPTVLAMQEVDRFQTRSDNRDQTAEIAGAIPGASWRFVPAIIGVPGEQWRPATDHDAAVVEFEGALMTIAGTHASFVPGWNIPQIRQITRALSKLPSPQILLGDLNLPAPVPALVTRWKGLATGLPTFPSPNPKVQLDHALLHDLAQQFNRDRRPIAARVEDLAFSDHRALIVEIG